MASGISGKVKGFVKSRRKVDFGIGAACGLLLCALVPALAFEAQKAAEGLRKHLPPSLGGPTTNS